MPRQRRRYRTKAVPTGISRVAKARKAKLAAIEMRKMAVGSGLVRPSVGFSVAAKTTSHSPASTR